MGTTMKQICSLDEIHHRQARSFHYDENYTFLIYRSGDSAFAYINSCPHTGISLEWKMDQFMSVDGLSLQCSTHGAQFEPATGLCIFGPCKGASLDKIEIIIENNVVYLV